ncbi:MAG: ATP-binding protein [Carboxydocellales bacterium]
MSTNTSEKKAINMIISSLAQTLLFMLVIILWYAWSRDPVALRGTAQSIILVGMSLVGVILAILAILGIKDIVRFSQYENDWNVTKAHLQGNQELLETLRAHRHDFINHLQVISGLIQLNKPQKAQDYLTQVVNELNNKKRISFVGRPEIDALLLKKLAQAQEMLIPFEVIAESEFKGLDILGYDIARILGNLIQNAFDASLPLPEEKRQIRVILREGPDQWEIVVYNQEPIISREQQARVFEKGYTTKGMSGNGLGLDIVKTLVAKHRGHVMLVSAEGQGTTFTVLLPKASSC